MSDTAGWLATVDLLRLVEQAGVPADAEALRTALARGDISAKAKYVDFVSSVGRVRSARDDWSIPRKLWAHRNSILDLEADTFSGRVSIDEGHLLGLVGASKFHCDRLLFHAAEAHEYLGIPVAVDQALVSEKRNKGGRRPAAGWPLFAAALAMWVERRNDTTEQLAAWGSDELWNEIDSILAGEWGHGGMARTTFQPALQEFLGRMKREADRQK